LSPREREEMGQKRQRKGRKEEEGEGRDMEKGKRPHYWILTLTLFGN
jgi:hypothetical protein